MKEKANGRDGKIVSRLEVVLGSRLGSDGCSGDVTTRSNSDGPAGDDTARPNSVPEPLRLHIPSSRGQGFSSQYFKRSRTRRTSRIEI